ncbi:hypothetical protein G6O69_19985 [Pseudenhygromyxa sp. WMMC2535]|uniref:hypothetical protein n=1 Tax=Pseudenhygromyxa sp. WMMC2535 TaxID=2712867 RepID=UPI001552F285|nr:hypothetical protein [Pseudenhygromyxa sp. WMMC2535]NVB40137.1 hypothetical protein [Pseudenhygromyxa sp. WMMC2535]
MRTRPSTPPRRLALCLSTGLALLAPGCKRDEPAEARRAEPTTYEQVEAGGEQDVREVEAAAYSRSLAEQLDLIPAGVDDYLVVRDLRPLIAQARRVEQVMAGPLERAIPALAKLGGGEALGDARLAQLRRGRQTLALLLAALEGAGLKLGQGLVIADPEGAPLLIFAAEDLERLGALASLVGEEAAELAAGCGPIPEQPGWFACRMGPAREDADPPSYHPGRGGAALVERLAASQRGVDLERVNLALSLGGGQADQDGRATIDATLRTDPQLWELTVPMPLPEGAQVLRPGRPQALRALVPGSPFAWLQLDPAGFEAGAPGLGAQAERLVTGELFLGPIDAPAGIVLQAGIRDASEAAQAIQGVSASQAIPSAPVEPEQFPGVRVEFSRDPIRLDGKLVPTIGLRASGEGAQPWAEALGITPQAWLWAYGDYLSLAAGDAAIPEALVRLRGEGPSPAAVAALPPTLARSLLAGEVGLVAYLVLDHWQAPPAEAELAALFAGVPEDQRPAAAELAALFETLAPWSSLALWLRQVDQRWLAQVSLVPFGAPGAGVDQAEAAAATAALDAVLAGASERATASYRELLESYPASPRAPSYRARLGQAPTHHAAVDMLELGIFSALIVPALDQYFQRAQEAEATAETEAMLAAALAVREKTGSCAALIGAAGPTPALDVPCHAGDGGRCRPQRAAQGDAPGRYPASVWTEDPLWSTLAWQPEGGHRFHYSFTAEAVGEGCRLIARAQGDLDGDGEFSSYTREVVVAEDGSRTSPPLAIEHGDE